MFAELKYGTINIYNCFLNKRVFMFLKCCHAKNWVFSWLSYSRSSVSLTLFPNAFWYTKQKHQKRVSALDT